MNSTNYTEEAIQLLKALIAIPRVSRQETEAADLLCQRMEEWGLTPHRDANNIWAVAKGYDERRPTLLLNAHIDTVKPVSTWTRQPNQPTVEGDHLYGLGANDCGGGLVSLLQVFRMLNEVPRQHNTVFLATAEEEISGKDGVGRVLPLLPPIDVAIVGEPTGMQPAVAEKGLMVIDGYAHGVSGHAARNEGVNAIYEALDDLCLLRSYQFEKVSPLLGPNKLTVTQVESGTQHNVVPDVLHFVLDVRTNEYYRNEDVLAELQQQMKKCELKARSFRLRSSSIPMDHPLVQRCLALGMTPYGSPTLSDKAQMPFPSLKLGPGQSSRSHSADEFICLSEIVQAINLYKALLEL
ncbi:MAG: M20 family metallo-hydrolase [Prevotella sp.]|nr:M20 family metallo-hydrolase [Prevotella sp.]